MLKLGGITKRSQKKKKLETWNEYFTENILKKSVTSACQKEDAGVTWHYSIGVNNVFLGLPEKKKNGSKTDGWNKIRNNLFKRI